MRRYGWLVILAFVQACNCGAKPHTNATSGIVVISVDGKDVTEDDTALAFDEQCLVNPALAPEKKSFLIKNTGQNVLTVKSVTLTGANAASFAITSTAPPSVAPLGQAEVDVQFAPIVAGNQSADVVIDTDDPDKGEVNVRLTGIGDTKPTEATYDTACNDASGAPTGNDTCQYLYFPDTAVGLASTQSVNVTNNGCAPLTITDVTIVNDALPDGGASFRVHGAAPSAANPITVATGATYALQLDFAPADPLNQSFGDMYVTTSGVPDADQHSGFLPDGGDLPDGVFYVSLSGQGTAPQVTLQPTSCDLSLTDGGGTCHAVLAGNGVDVLANFTLQNTGNQSVQVTSVTVPADDAGTFEVALPAPAPFTLDGENGANSTVNIALTYHPFNGAVSEDLVVVTNIGSLSAHLSGGSPAVISVPTELSFNDGGFDPDDFVSPQALQVVNTGLSPLIIQTPSITQDLGFTDGGEAPCTFVDSSGTPQPRFTLVSVAPSSPFPLTLGAGGSSTWTLSHTRDPHSGGPEQCNLNIPSNASGSPVVPVILTASTPVNCNPFATFTPTGTLLASATTDGGVYVVDGSQSFDTEFDTTPVCPNGLSDGLSSFHWKLSVPPSSPAYGTHLEALVSGATCAQSNDGGCVDLTVSTAGALFPPFGDTALVNLVVSGHDASQPVMTLGLTVTDATGRTNTAANVLTVTPEP